MYERSSKAKLIFFLIVLVIIFAFIPSRWKTPVKMKVIGLFSPATNFVNDKTTKIKDTFSMLLHLGDIKKEKKDLEKNIENLKADLVEFEEYRLENQRLRHLLDLRKNLQKYDVISANVIARDVTNWSRSLIIDKGSEDGISPGDPVVSYGGLVGSVYECGASQSKVMLLIDNNARAGVIVQRTRDLGVTEGQSSDIMTLKYIPRTSDIRTGDILISSGMGQIYPKGIKVGEIIKVYEEKASLYKFAEVKPDVNFGKLEEVVVIIQSSIRKLREQEDALQSEDLPPEDTKEP